jgi:cadmium resistance transport/sequestration family protein
MNFILGAIISSIAAFIATNLDDIVILTIFFAQINNSTNNLHQRHIIAGQYLGFTGLIIASLPGFFGGLVIQQHVIGLLGFLPIFIGIYQLIKIIPGDSNSEIPAVVNPAKPNKLTSFLNKFIAPQTSSVAAITFANGGDNISIYVPLFASSNWLSLLITLTIFYLLVGIWCYLGYHLTRDFVVTENFTKYGNILTPLILISLGIYILIDSQTFELFILN